MGDHHDNHRTLPLVAPGNEGSGRRRLPSHGSQLARILRDIHSVTGVWVSSLALLMLFSGLPWAKFWGDYLKSVRRLTGTAVARQDWTNGQPSVASPALDESDEHSDHHASPGEHSDHHASLGHKQHGGNAPKTGAAIDRIVASVQPLNLPPPVAIAGPERGSDFWTAKSLTANRPISVDLELDGATGSIISRKGFRDRQLIDKLVGIGSATRT